MSMPEIFTPLDDRVLSEGDILGTVKEDEA